jgi:hypothetical protein
MSIPMNNKIIHVNVLLYPSTKQLACQLVLGPVVVTIDNTQHYLTLLA